MIILKIKKYYKSRCPNYFSQKFKKNKKLKNIKIIYFLKNFYRLASNFGTSTITVKKILKIFLKKVNLLNGNI